MKKFILYLLLIMFTITAIAVTINDINNWWLLLIIITIWAIIIYKKIKKEQEKQFRDWEMRKYKYNAQSNKETKEHYKEYKNERKNNESAN